MSSSVNPDVSERLFQTKFRELRIAFKESSVYWPEGQTVPERQTDRETDFTSETETVIHIRQHVQTERDS